MFVCSYVNSKKFSKQHQECCIDQSNSSMVGSRCLLNLRKRSATKRLEITSDSTIQKKPTQDNVKNAVIMPKGSYYGKIEFSVKNNQHYEQTQSNWIINVWLNQESFMSFKTLKLSWLSTAIFQIHFTNPTYHKY